MQQLTSWHNDMATDGTKGGTKRAAEVGDAPTIAAPPDASENANKIEISFNTENSKIQVLQNGLSNIKLPAHELAIDLPKCKLTKDNINDMTFAITSQRHAIKKFSCSMPQCQTVVADASFAQFTNSLTKTKLENLIFNLQGSAFNKNDNTLRGLTEVLKCNSALKEVTLNVKNNGFSNHSVSGFFKALSQLEKLEYVYLDFSQSANMNKDSIINAFQNLTEIPSLRELHLAVSHNDEVDGEEISALTASLTFKNLNCVVFVANPLEQELKKPSTRLSHGAV